MVVPKLFKSAHKPPWRLWLSWKAMSTVRPACVPPAQWPCGISCRRKATPARSSGPEAVGASTPLMWQPQNTERRALALRLHHVIGRDPRLVGQGAVILHTLSENAQIQIMEAGLVATLQSWFQHALHPTFPPGRQGSLTEQPAPTRCLGRQIVPLLFRQTDGSLVHRQRRQSPCIVLSKNPRKARCNVLEIMPWTEYNETYILHHQPEERSPWEKARAERILRSGKGLCWC